MPLKMTNIFAVTSPRPLNENDLPYLQTHYGYNDDYSKLLEKGQFIFRSHYSSLNVKIDSPAVNYGVWSMF